MRPALAAVLGLTSVMVPHAGVVNLLLGARSRYQPDADAVFGVPTPYVFDVSVYNIFSSLVVHCATCRLLQDGAALTSLNAGAPALTRVAAVPSILAVARLPSSVTDVEAGGEALVLGDAADDAGAAVNWGVVTASLVCVAHLDRYFGRCFNRYF